MKRALFLVAINAFPFLLILAHCEDLWTIYYGNEDYPFGSAFFAPYSIYQSQSLYVSFVAVHTLFLISLIVCSIFRKWKLYYVLLVVCIVMLFYPMLTNE